MRRNPKQAGRAFADWLRRHRGERATTVDPNRAASARSGQSTARAERLRRAFPSSRVTPYQLRRELTW